MLSKIAYGDGADVKVGEVLGVIDEGAAGAETAPANRQPETVSQRPEAGSRKPEADSRQPAAGSPEPPAGADKTRATPAAKNVAAKNAVDLKTVQGTGDAGRVMRRDVESAVAPVANSGRRPRPRPAR